MVTEPLAAEIGGFLKRLDIEHGVNGPVARQRWKAARIITPPAIADERGRSSPTPSRALDHSENEQAHPGRGTIRILRQSIGRPPWISKGGRRKRNERHNDGYRKQEDEMLPTKVFEQPAPDDRAGGDAHARRCSPKTYSPRSRSAFDEAVEISESVEGKIIAARRHHGRAA